MTTRTDIGERMGELSNPTSVLGDFRSLGHVLVDDVESCERKLHENFSAFRVQNNREFFRMPLQQIVFFIKDLIADKIIRDYLPPVSTNQEVSLDYFLTFRNLMSFLRFYNDYGCRVYSGLIVFLCKSLGYDLSSKLKRSKFFFKLRGLQESRFNEFEETFIHFDDLTREYKNKIEF
jgi:hypothetical protein